MAPISHLLRRAFSSSASLSSISRIIFKDSHLKTVVESFKKYSELDDFRHKPAFYEHTVKRLANAKRFDLIKEILEEQKKYKNITREGFTIRLISLYGKSGMSDYAHKLFDEMPQLNCRRTVKSFNALLGACVSSNKFDRVEGLFRELPGKLSIKPDVVSYNTVIKAFCEMGLLDSASSMLVEMEKEGVSPDLITFNTLITAFYRNERFAEGEEVWGMMVKYNVVPDIISYNMKLHGLVSVKKIQEALALVEEIKTRELKPDVFTFNTLFKVLCNDDKSIEEAKKWYDEMMKIKCAPNRLTFATLLRFACDKGDFDFAARLCRGLFYRHYQLNKGALVQKVVDGLVNQSNRKEAELLVRLGKQSKFSCYHGLKMPMQD